MTSPSPRHFWEKQLGSFGARPDDIVLLDETAIPAQKIRYLDLFRAAQNDAGSLWPTAVVEVQGQPVLYVVEDLAAARAGSDGLTRLRRILAFRAGADYLAISEPGRLTVYPVAPASNEELKEETRIIQKGGETAPVLIPSLSFPPLSADLGRKRAQSSAVEVHSLLFGLLTSTTTTLTESGIDHLDALSLVGRALFVRFLVDRRVLRDIDILGICGSRTETCFASPAAAASMCRWLNVTFNGDFLPLPDDDSGLWFKKLPSRVFDELSKILVRATPSGQLHLEWGHGWDDLRFDHIPVGLLSQVYEDHAHKFDPVIASMTSVRYTPRHIAEYMVDEVFFALGERADGARVLDPSVGGGVFLVAAFRRLAAEWWRAKGSPPDAQNLREILYSCLRGFDISPHALRLCSLGLYLTAVELDPNPRPPSGLRFDKPLLGTVLHDVSAENKRHAYLGSLDRQCVDKKHQGQTYDVVIGNPPWKSWATTKSIGKEDIETQVRQVENTVRDIVRDRLMEEDARAYEMVDRNPDLPFLWRAMEWANEGGHIALALHGRFLFKQSAPGRTARDAIFRAISVDGILNGTALRDTDFWPEVRAPFCLLFARNTRPSGDASFWFVSPEMEKGLNDQGKLRIDDASALPVSTEEVSKKPWLLKTLSRGTTLDLHVLEQMERTGRQTLLAYWKEKKWDNRKGQGFKVGGDDPTRKKWPAEDLWELPELKPHKSLPFLIEPQKLRLPAVQRGVEMQHPRARTIYQEPLVLIAQSLPVDRTKPAAHLCFADIAYNESFTGFSCAGHPEGEALSRYLFLLFNSHLLAYHALMTSGKFGFERDAMLVDDIYQLPFRKLEALPPSLKAQIEPLSNTLVRQGRAVLHDVDEFIADIYGLTRSDREVVRDTLEVGPPFAHARAKAQSRPDDQALAKYIARLKQVVAPFLSRRGRALTIRPIRNNPNEPWLILQVDSHVEGRSPAPKQQDGEALAAIVDAADSLAATRVLAAHPPATLVIGIVAQYRYLTPSRARLLGLDLLQEHEAILLGKGAP